MCISGLSSISYLFDNRIVIIDISFKMEMNDKIPLLMRKESKEGKKRIIPMGSITPEKLLWLCLHNEGVRGVLLGYNRR